jgi:hypothetical protein
MILFLWYGVLILLFVYCLKNREGFSDGIQFIRIVNSTQSVPNYIQIGELMAFDKNGTNLALGKPTTSSGHWSSNYAPSKATDNQKNTSFHSAKPPTENDFWEVDLGKEYNLSRIDYYNRHNCCQERIIGCTMHLLNKNREMVNKIDFETGEMFQTFSLSTDEEPASAIRNRARWL